MPETHSFPSITHLSKKHTFYPLALKKKKRLCWFPSFFSLYSFSPLANSVGSILHLSTSLCYHWHYPSLLYAIIDFCLDVFVFLLGAQQIATKLAVLNNASLLSQFLLVRSPGTVWLDSLFRVSPD